MDFDWFTYQNVRAGESALSTFETKIILNGLDYVVEIDKGVYML